MNVEDTLDPFQVTTRKVTSMSEMVAEMVLGACGEDDSAAAADAAALAAAREVAVTGELVATSPPPAPAPPAPPAPPTVFATFAPPAILAPQAVLPPPSRARQVAATALGVLVLLGGAAIATLASR